MTKTEFEQIKTEIESMKVHACEARNEYIEYIEKADVIRLLSKFIETESKGSDSWPVRAQFTVGYPPERWIAPDNQELGK